MILFNFALVIVACIGLYLSFSSNNKSKRHDYLSNFSRAEQRSSSIKKDQAVDLKSLYGLTLTDRMKNQWRNLLKQLGQYAAVKGLVFTAVLFFIAQFLNNNFLRMQFLLVFVVVFLFGCFLGYQWLQKKQRSVFEESFPVALNMLTSAISAGESITQSISYVGETLDGAVADEFRSMGQRLQMGESPEDVFRKSCLRLPYPSFFFFVITLRANIERGGQLKDIIQRLNRLMFNARAIEKKKFAMTSEARASAKIVAAIPFIFLLVLKYLSPENFDYITNDPTGRLILYYMLISEFIGISIVWGLMRNVR